MFVGTLVVLKMETPFVAALNSSESLMVPMVGGVLVVNQTFNGPFSVKSRRLVAKSAFAGTLTR